MVHKNQKIIVNMRRDLRKTMKIGQNSKRKEKKKTHEKGEAVLESQNLKRASYD